MATPGKKGNRVVDIGNPDEIGQPSPPTGGFARETGGNLAALVSAIGTSAAGLLKNIADAVGRIPALGAALAAASVPVTLATDDVVRMWSPGLNAAGEAVTPPGPIELTDDHVKLVSTDLALRKGKAYLFEVDIPAHPVVTDTQSPDLTYSVQLALVAHGTAAPADTFVQKFEHYYDRDVRGFTPLADADLYAIRAAGKAGISIRVVGGQE